MSAQPQTSPVTDPAPPHVLLVDADADMSELVTAILGDEGYKVTTLVEFEHAAVAAAVGRHEPDCILLDAAGHDAFGGSWGEAAYLSNRDRAVPTVMFTAHARAVAEATERTTQRAIDAEFAAILPKPFTLDELLDAVEKATSRSVPFDRSEEADDRRSAELAAGLRAGGATDIRTSERREWATFVSPHDDRIYQLYWWQRKGLYMVGRYDEDARLELVGRFFERTAAMAAAMDPSATASLGG